MVLLNILSFTREEAMSYASFTDVLFQDDSDETYELFDNEYRRASETEYGFDP